MTVDCQLCRTSLSARMDGEAEAAPSHQVDAHLRRCASCREWQASASALTRPLRVGLVRPTPDLTDAILARAPRPERRLTTLRFALGATALAQLLLSIAQVLGLGEHMSMHAEQAMTSHLFNESTAWNVALGLGMLWAAIRVRTVAGMLPVLGVFVAVLAAFSTHDLITGSAPISRVASHGFLAVGFVLLLAMHREIRNRRDPSPGTSDAAPSNQNDITASTQENSTGRTDDPGNPPLRPTAHHRAA